MVIAFVLVHDGTNLSNRQQIQALSTLIETHADNLGNDPDTGEPVIDRYYTILGVTPSHRAIFLQVIPQGVQVPNNLRLIDSYNVYYGADQPSHNRRFFNWGIKRAIELGADAVALIQNVSLLTAVDIDLTLANLRNQRIWEDRTWGRMITKRLFAIGRLREDLTIAEAITNMKARLVAAGYTHG
jgi:hypothetical protein